ncbi:hypothetical protein BJ165DRAFT_1464604, partial [Panaeolus papilionaceus]
NSSANSAANPTSPSCTSPNSELDIGEQGVVSRLSIVLREVAEEIRRVTGSCNHTVVRHTTKIRVVDSEYSAAREFQPKRPSIFIPLQRLRRSSQYYRFICNPTVGISWGIPQLTTCNLNQHTPLDFKCLKTSWTRDDGHVITTRRWILPTSFAILDNHSTTSPKAQVAHYQCISITHHLPSRCLAHVRSSAFHRCSSPTTPYQNWLSSPSAQPNSSSFCHFIPTYYLWSSLRSRRCRSCERTLRGDKEESVLSPEERTSAIRRHGPHALCLLPQARLQELTSLLLEHQPEHLTLLIVYFCVLWVWQMVQEALLLAGGLMA